MQYTVLPESAYTVHAFAFDPNDPNGPDEREQVTVVIEAIAQPAPTLDDMMYQLVRAQRSIKELNDAGEITFFDISAAMQRAVILLDADVATGEP